jgi:transposase-like protein
VRWYLPYCLSYRDLEEMIAERGLKVDHTTVRLDSKLVRIYHRGKLVRFLQQNH